MTVWRSTVIACAVLAVGCASAKPGPPVAPLRVSPAESNAEPGAKPLEAAREAYAGKLVATRVVARDPVDQVYGTLRLGKSTDAVIRDLRGPAR